MDNEFWIIMIPAIIILLIEIFLKYGMPWQWFKKEETFNIKEDENCQR